MRDTGKFAEALLTCGRALQIDPRSAEIPYKVAKYQRWFIYAADGDPPASPWLTAMEFLFLGVRPASRIL